MRPCELYAHMMETQKRANAAAEWLKPALRSSTAHYGELRNALSMNRIEAQQAWKDSASYRLDRRRAKAFLDNPEMSHLRSPWSPDEQAAMKDRVRLAGHLDDFRASWGKQLKPGVSTTIQLPYGARGVR